VKKADWLRVYKTYGAEAIGSVLGVPAATVRRWAGKGKSAGLPQSRHREIEALETIRQHEGYEEKALKEMMAQARQAGKLSPALLLQIRNYLETTPMARSLPNWLASVEMSVLAGDQNIYVAAPVRFQVDHPEADDFIVDSLESSGLQHSRRAAIDSVIGKLRDKLRSDARFYVHGASFSTYKYKTEDEAKELRRERRRRK